MTRVYYTPQITLSHDIKFADCEPTVISSNSTLANAYFIADYTKRSAWYHFNKGPFAPPFLLSSIINDSIVSYTIYFNTFTGGTCPTNYCNIQCTNEDFYFISGNVTGAPVQFCFNNDNFIYHFDVAFDSTGDITALPANFNFTFEDQLGNQNSLDVQSIANIIPAAPVVGVELRSDGVTKSYVAVIPRTQDYTELTEDNLEQYIIERCDWPSYSNIKTFRGFINYPSTDYMYTDSLISSGQTVGYRVKFKNKWGELSQPSSWTIGNS